MNDSRIPVVAQRAVPLLFVSFLIGCFLSAGCSDGSGSGRSKQVEVPTTDMSGALNIPTTVNNLLLTSILAAQNTDSDVRNAFASAAVYVNDAPAPNRTITPSSVTSNWDFKILGVPQTSTGIYKLHFIVGRLALKSWVPTALKDSATIDSRTTAAALLAEAAKMQAPDLLASFPAIVSKVALQVESAFNASFTQVQGTIFNLPALKNEVASQADFLTKNKDFDPQALVAYLGASNDLDGNGVPDVKVSQTVDRTGIRFETAISSQTTLMENISNLASYPDATLLNDFAAGNTRSDRTFDASAKNVGLGLFFSRSAGGDSYIKLLVKRVDLKDGTFSGVVTEYAFVTSSGTAVATGTKTLRVKDSQAGTDTVEGTNFLTDNVATTGYLAYLDYEKGMGSGDGATRIVRAVDGQPDLSKLSSAEPYGEGTSYSVNTANALKAVNKNRGLEVGDVFSAYFKDARHYALFKISALSSETVTIEYVVNAAINEPRF